MYILIMPSHQRIEFETKAQAESFARKAGGKKVKTPKGSSIYGKLCYVSAAGLIEIIPKSSLI